MVDQQETRERAYLHWFAVLSGSVMGAAFWLELPGLVVFPLVVLLVAGGIFGALRV